MSAGRKECHRCTTAKRCKNWCHSTAQGSRTWIKWQGNRMCAEQKLREHGQGAIVFDDTSSRTFTIAANPPKKSWVILPARKLRSGSNERVWRGCDQSSEDWYGQERRGLHLGRVEGWRKLRLQSSWCLDSIEMRSKHLRYAQTSSFVGQMDHKLS